MWCSERKGGEGYVRRMMGMKKGIEVEMDLMEW